jgi:glycine/D-amino acid oxidase-like deaminating enzyme
VLTTGAWLSRLLPGLGLPLQPERVVMFWLQPRQREKDFALGRFPVWLWDAGALGFFYGFPHVEWPGVTVARHHSGEACDPDTVRRTVDAADDMRVREFLRGHIPALDGHLLAAKVCLYANTPDEHFVVDRHPEVPQVVYAGGFSGHGFKFASVIGALLADLALDGRTMPEADFLRADRFAPTA